MAGWSAPWTARVGEDSTMQVTTLDTGEAIVPLTPYGAEPPPPPRAVGRWLVPLVALFAAILFACWALYLPYLAIAPGSATNVNELISAPADRAFPPRGDVLLLTVSLLGLEGESRKSGLRPLEILEAWADPDTDVVEKEVVLGGSSDRQLLQENRELMVDSQTTAKFVAFRRLGYDVVEQGEGGRVLGVAPEAPAAAKLQPGEVITAVDGQPVATSNAVIDTILARKPGDVITFTVVREDGSPARSVPLTLGTRSGDGLSCFTGAAGGTGSPCIGVSLSTKNRSFNFPFEVTIDAGRIGGPSAGLAFTLGVLDYLTPGELTGGGKIAVMGAIGSDGQVGVVGGVAQKTAAAIEEGAEYFLVPNDTRLYEEARAKAGNRLTVIPVATLEDAVQALGRIGGDIGALGPPPTTAQG